MNISIRYVLTYTFFFLFLVFCNDFHFFYYTWFTVFCQFSTVQQDDPVIYIYTLFFLTVMSHILLKYIQRKIQRNFRSVFFLFRATFVAYGSSQARGQIRAIAAILHYNQSKGGSKLCLQPTPQPMATLDP